MLENRERDQELNQDFLNNRDEKWIHQNTTSKFSFKPSITTNLD